MQPRPFHLLPVVGAVLLVLMLGLPARAAGRLELAQAQLVFPGADQVDLAGGSPGVVQVFQAGKLVGYAWLSHEVANTTGFSGRPIDVLVGMDVNGKIAGARIIEHHEPILAVGVSEQRLRDFVAQYAGRDGRDATHLGQAGGIEPVTGASVSSLLLNDAILRSARLVARAQGLGGAPPGDDPTHGGRIDLESYTPSSWDDLLADGSVARLLVPEARTPDQVQGAPAGPFIDLYAALVLPPRIGRNLLGDVLYSRLMHTLPERGAAILIAASGRYSFKGTAFAREGVFDRVQLVQNDRTIRLRAGWHERVEKLRASGAPELRELGLFVIPPDVGFDPARAWRLDLIAPASGTGGDGPVILPLIYQLPARYLPPPQPPPTPMWEEVWCGQRVAIGSLAVMLLALTGILFSQNAIARRRRLHLAVRSVQLLVTLAWLGWYYGAQLSVLNVLTFVSALLSGFSWDMFLLAPFIFMLWGFAALAMLFWGRGIFCGWLCPFGALQEFASRIARWCRLPQWRVPFVLHERLWPIKYVAFVGLLAISLQGLEHAFAFLEVEPFKTAVVLRFDRAWPYVLYAAAILGIGMFVERFFCRYLCPLGAALALPAPLRTFEWLRRRTQCGTECQICASRCPVQAIHPEGKINVHECIYCLGCQVNYYDDQLCPPLIERRRRRDARAAARAVPAAGD